MNRPLRVTLVGGFLGAGKTSLLHHFISEHATSPLAILVESSGPLNLDAKAFRGLFGAMSRTDDVVEEIPAIDEPAQIDWLAHQLEHLSRDGEIERVIIEASGTSNAARFGRYFGLLPGQASQLGDYAMLDRIICVVDSLDFYRTFCLVPQDGEPAAFLKFQRTQIEGASLVVLNKCDILDDAECAKCEEALREINPHATLLETSYGELPLVYWSQSETPSQLALAVEERPDLEDEKQDLESISAGMHLNSAVFRAHRPFHPARLWDWFEANHPGLLRVKGLIWLATRNLLVGGISRTRWQSSCGGAGIWWAALPREEWPTERESLEAMQKTWREPWGDRRQELTLIGDARALPDILQVLKGCLLSDDEFGRSVAEWRALPDPFPAWDVGEGS